MAQRRDRRKPESSAVRIYFEGHRRLRPGFRTFFSEIYDRGGVTLIAGGGRNQAIQDYKDAMRTHPEAWNILILDAEGPDDGRLFGRLSIRVASRECVFFMVQIMESWFLADVETLKNYYGKGFEAIPRSDDVETVPKRNVYRLLDQATRETKKGKYSESKLDHSAELLSRLDVNLVKSASKNCRRIFETVTKQLA